MNDSLEQPDLSPKVESVTESLPRTGHTAEPIHADTLFGIYCNGNPASVPKEQVIYWEGWQRVAEYIARHAAQAPAQTVRGCSFCGQLQGHAATCWTVEQVNENQQQAALIAKLAEGIREFNRVYKSLGKTNISLLEWADNVREQSGAVEALLSLPGVPKEEKKS